MKANNGTVEIDINEVDNRILTAFATLRNTTVFSLVQQYGVEGAISMAIQEQIHVEIGAGIKDDVRSILIADWSNVWSSISQYRTTNKKVPESIISGIEARIPTQTAS